jgi:hypothetical protein
MVKTLTDPFQIHMYMRTNCGLDPHQYLINDQSVVDTHVGFTIHNPHITKIQVKFGTVNGGLDIKCTKLLSLKNLPSHVMGNFGIVGGKLTSMEGAPELVQGHVDILGCKQLVSLKGFPIQVGGHVSIDRAAINSTQLQYLPRHIKGSLYINQCVNLFDLQGAPAQIDDTLDLRVCPIRSLNGFEGCGNKLVLDYDPNLPLLKSLLAQQGVYLLNRGGHTSGPFIIDTNDIMEVINKYAGKGKSAMLNAALDLKKLGKHMNPQMDNPFEHNAKW